MVTPVSHGSSKYRTCLIRSTSCVNGIPLTETNWDTVSQITGAIINTRCISMFNLDLPRSTFIFGLIMTSHYMIQCWFIIEWILASNFSETWMKIHIVSYENVPKLISTLIWITHWTMMQWPGRKKLPFSGQRTHLFRYIGPVHERIYMIVYCLPDLWVFCNYSSNLTIWLLDLRPQFRHVLQLFVFLVGNYGLFHGMCTKLCCVFFC